MKRAEQQLMGWEGVCHLHAVCLCFHNKQASHMQRSSTQHTAFLRAVCMHSPQTCSVCVPLAPRTRRNFAALTLTFTRSPPSSLRRRPWVRPRTCGDCNIARCDTCPSPSRHAPAQESGGEALAGGCPHRHTACCRPCSHTREAADGSPRARRRSCNTGGVGGREDSSRGAAPRVASADAVCPRVDTRSAGACVRACMWIATQAQLIPTHHPTLLSSVPPQIAFIHSHSHSNCNALVSLRVWGMGTQRCIRFSVLSSIQPPKHARCKAPVLSVGSL
jgi:hypothetical protein